MDETIELELPWPPSWNQSYRYRAVGRKAMGYQTKQAKEYKAIVSDLCIAHDLQPIKGWVEVSIWLYFPRRGGDLDNRCKILLDALQGHAYLDDKQVSILHVYRRYQKGGGMAWVEIKKSGYTE